LRESWLGITQSKTCLQRIEGRCLQEAAATKVHAARV
jgi:hypothetical protein